MIRQVRTFRIGHVIYGIDVGDVQEIISAHPLARLTALRSDVFGAARPRGRIVIDIDLRPQLAPDATADGTLPAKVVVHTEAGAASFSVDEIGAVIEVEETSLRRLPVVEGAVMVGFVSGVYWYEHALLHLIDAAAVSGMPDVFRLSLQRATGAIELAHVG